MASNCYPVKDQYEQSKQTPMKHGVYYGGNSQKTAKEMMAEGSESPARNQGFLRDSIDVALEDMGAPKGQNKRFEEGSAAKYHI